MKLPIPVVDLFAGPGGLSEGFSRVTDEQGRPAFKVVLSIEKDEGAHRTLLLRSFFRQFGTSSVPADYYRYLKREISREDLFRNHPREARTATNEAWLATLGHTSAALVKERIAKALRGAEVWVLIGGPPCQAYSLVGRSRMRSSHPEEFESDHRHFLYREYLRIIADHRPPLFVMENVKGLLSSSVRGLNTFERIRTDLSKPLKALQRPKSGEDLAYDLYPLTGGGSGGHAKPGEFVIRSEQYGVPQARHRVIILGVRRDSHEHEGINALAELSNANAQVSVEEVIGDLPRLRSGLSGGADDDEDWKAALQRGSERIIRESTKTDDLQLRKVVDRTRIVVAGLSIPLRGRGSPFIRAKSRLQIHASWYLDPRLDGVCNHEARRHMESDLYRYLFCACFAAVAGRSPQLKDFPSWLLPNHRNATEGVKGSMFSDRFRVQTKKTPATTITSHIAKDGHYFIHYDPTQCRSLSVREAARLQTFPDNYFFEGNRTQQYAQVGNAVPPFLARQIGEVALRVLIASGVMVAADAQHKRSGQKSQRGALGRQTSIPRSSKA